MAPPTTTAQGKLLVQDGDVDSDDDELAQTRCNWIWCKLPVNYLTDGWLMASVYPVHPMTIRYLLSRSRSR